MLKSPALVAVAVLAAVVVAMAWPRAALSHRSFTDDANVERCAKVAEARLTVIAVAAAPVSRTSAERSARRARLAAVSEFYGAVRADADIPEPLRNSFAIAEGSVNRAVVALASARTEPKVAGLLHALKNTNENMAEWCVEQTPPI